MSLPLREPRALVDRLLALLAGLGALVALVIATVVALPLSAIVVFVALLPITALMSLLGLDAAVSPVVATGLIVGVPALTLIAVVWVYRRLPTRVRAGLEESTDAGPMPARRLDEVLWQEVSRLDSRFVATGDPQAGARTSSRNANERGERSSE